MSSASVKTKDYFTPLLSEIQSEIDHFLNLREEVLAAKNYALAHKLSARIGAAGNLRTALHRYLETL